MKRDEVLESLFNDPTLKAEKGFFLTSDNQAFAERNKSDGVNHAKKLENGSLDWCERPKVELVEAVAAEVKQDVAVETATEVDKPAPAKKEKAEKVKADAAPEANAEMGDIDGTILN